MELSLFSFQSTSSPLTKLPAGIKLLALFFAIASLFSINLTVALVLCPLLILFSAIMGFSLASQLKDFLPILAYLILYYLMAVTINAIQAGSLSSQSLIPSRKIILSILRLLLSVQLASLLYKSTTTTQIKFSLQKAESFLRRLLHSIPFIGNKIDTRASTTFSLTLVISFIPSIMSLWNQLEVSWRARGGKPGLSMVRTLLPQLLVLAFQDAEDSWQAIASREQPED